MTIDRILLFPYYLILRLRDSLYASGRRKTACAEVPAICVGNITAGGTGKTPHVEMILRLLQESQEWRDKNIAVLSRGYRRESKGFQQVDTAGSAADFGDEPLQIKKKFPEVTVAVDKDRIEGCRLLCHPEILRNRKYARRCWNRDFPAAQLIVLDDAFQYRSLKAAKTVLLADYSRPVGKDMLLPLGRLRDLKERISEADVLIVTKSPADMDIADKQRYCLDKLGLDSYDADTCTVRYPDGRTQLLLFSCIRYGQCLGVYPEFDPHYIYARKAVLVTGIAKDSHIRAYLSDYYKIIKRFQFSDHHKYGWTDINRIQNAIMRNPVAAIATTEKDAQRLQDFKGMPQTLKERMFMLPIEMGFLSDGEKALFLQYITRY